MGRRQGATREHILNRYVTEEQRRRRPIFIATLRAARLSAGCFVAHRSKTTAGILPLRFAHPAEIRGGAAGREVTPAILSIPLRSDVPSKFRGLVNLLAATLCTGIILAPFIALLELP